MIVEDFSYKWWPVTDKKWPDYVKYFSPSFPHPLHSQFLIFLFSISQDIIVCSLFKLWLILDSVPGLHGIL